MGSDLDGFDLGALGLTNDQQRAVEYDDGPVIVLAGPGTGKTRVITARVGHMIQNRGVAPEQIVAVTFTNKAAGELSERLGELVGSSIAARVVSSTFHSLGLGIVRRFGDVIGVASEPTLIDSSQRRQLIRELIREHKLYGYALGAGIESAIEIATKAMNELRNLGMDSEHAARWMHDQRELVSGFERSEKEAKNAELDRFEHAIQVYGHFEKRCLDRGWMVFDDLILLPTKLMREHSSIASMLRHDHRHVVVDEFQDVNPAQIALIEQLCPPTSNPDLCVVGDDDQSIYGFRGADDRAFAHFASMYVGSPTITLSTNFRSAEAIVDASNAIIERAASRFDATKTAQSHSGKVDGACVEVVRLEEDGQSSEVIASMLVAMAGKDGFKFGDCAVIARTTAELERIARVLTLEGIPVEFQQKLSPMDDEGVKDVIVWIRLIGNPDSAVDLKRVLVRPPYRCDAIGVGGLIASWRVAKSRVEAGDEDAVDPRRLIAWICARGDDAMVTRMKRVEALLETLGQVASAAPAAATIMEIIKRTGVVHQELGDGYQRANRIAALVALIRFAHSRADRFEAPGDVSAMLRYWEDLDPNEKSLGELPEHKVEDRNEPIGGAKSSSSADLGAVLMLTAHASKGLEFDTVFIPRVSGPHGYPKSGNTDEDVVPDGLVDRDGDARDEKTRRMDEERRVFYVALTRAHKRAVLLAKVPKKASSVNFVYELREALGSAMIEHDASDMMNPDSMGDAVSRLGAEFKSASRMRDVFDQARQDARREAAGAIDAMEMGEIDRDALAVKLNACADRIALVNAIRATGKAPAWSKESGHDELAQMLLTTLENADSQEEGGLHPGLVGPLKLSFTQISSYLRCPRCYLVEQVLGLPSDEQVHAVVGKALHEALEQFYVLWRAADAEGGAAPGYAVLEKMVRKYFLKHWPIGQEVDASKLEQSLAMTKRFWETMHHEDAHIEELEKKHTLEYVHDGVNHQIRAVVDRVDATPSGGRRVIDYKTGYPRKELSEPKKDDLQLGIYAMVLNAMYGDPGPGSACEYWLLQDGTVGSIAMDAIDMVKVRKKIDNAISGILNGDWTQSSRCKNGQGESACSILDDVTDLEGLMERNGADGAGIG